MNKEIFDLIFAQICASPKFIIPVVVLFYLGILLITLQAGLKRIDAAKKSGRSPWAPRLLYLTSPLLLLFALAALVLSYFIAPAFYTGLVIVIPLGILLVLAFYFVNHFQEIVHKILKQIGPWGECILHFIETSPNLIFKKAQLAWGKAKSMFVLWSIRHPQPKILVDSDVQALLSRIGLSSQSLLQQIAQDPYCRLSRPVDVIHALGRTNALENLSMLGQDPYISDSIRSMAASELEYKGATLDAALVWESIGKQSKSTFHQLQAAEHLYRRGKLSVVEQIIGMVNDTDELEHRWAVRVKDLQWKVEHAKSPGQQPPELDPTNQEPADQLLTAETMLTWGKADQAAILLVDIATEPENPLLVRQRAINLMKTYRLLKALQATIAHADLSASLRYLAAQAFVQNGENQLGIQEFLAIAQDDQINIRERSSAALALVVLDPSENTRKLILDLIGHPAQDNDLRLQLAQAMQTAGWLEDASRILVTMIRDPGIDKITRGMAQRNLDRILSS